MDGLKSESPEQLTVAEASQRLGVNRNVIYGWIRRTPDLPIRRVGRRIYIYAGAVASFSSQRTKRRSLNKGGPDSLSRIPDGHDSQAPDSGHNEAQTPIENSEVNPATVAPPMPAVNPSCGQRELRIPQRTRFGGGLVIFSGFQFLG
jgi:hypothetical protein